jgi:CheY-like chemotaxis protein
MEAAGFSSSLVKPVRISALLNAIHEALDSHPKRASLQRADPAPSTPSEANAVGCRILLAEDNHINQKVALGILRKLGHHADAVSNGLEALKALEALPYDLVLMDVQMPEMDGIEATRRIRMPSSKVLDRNIPIIAMTAHAMAGDREHCLSCGMDDYVSKPVSSRTLTEALARWLPITAGLAKPDPRSL